MKSLRAALDSYVASYAMGSAGFEPATNRLRELYRIRAARRSRTDRQHPQGGGQK
jgi:hypothetical protein